MKSARMIRPGQGGFALFASLLVLMLVSLLGLALVLVASEESRVAENHLRGEQASWAALGTLRCARMWLEDPAASSGFAVPLVAEMDRTQRRVDPMGTGVFVPWSAAPPPWNVVYRSGTNDPFARPFRGTPMLAFDGAGNGPDVAISRGGSAAESAFLDRLSGLLFPGFPSPSLRARVSRVDFSGPPVDRSTAPARRLGIATLAVKVIVTASDAMGGEREVAVRSARAVLAEPPYREALGPILAGGSIDASRGLDARWGLVAARGGILFPLPGGAAAMPSGWPRRAAGFALVPDSDGDGTIDDTDGDGTGDCAEWLALADDTLEDPWFFASAGGTLPGAPSPPGPDQLAWPFDPGLIPGSGSAVYVPSADASNLMQGATPDPVPVLSSARWEFLKSASRSGLRGHHYFAFDASSGLWKEDGTGAPLDPAAATSGRSGFFFFDTADAVPPRDTDGDGTADNLAPAVTISAGWTSAGVIILGAASLRFDALGWGGVAQSVALPAEPCADLDGDASCGPAEPFLSLLPAADPLAPGAVFRRLALLWPGAGTPRRDPAGAADAPVAFDGVVILAGNLISGGNLVIHGGVIVGGDLLAPDPAAPPGPPPDLLRILADAGLPRGTSPGLSTGAPRTFITSLWRESEVQATALP